ncbi:MAG TPA: diacylglycerol kinase family lipid kinase [Acidiferrobacteraceae bacterium]|nr:diacylglycerol kinase family lipid kinase [Acidiferrobacteraceae bacterium]
MHPVCLPRTRLVVIHNPTAGGRRRHRFEATLKVLRNEGCTVEVMPTTAPGDAEKLARQAIHSKPDAVVVAGGDGTINEAINGLAGSTCPLAVIPMGTANVLASELSLPLSPRMIARNIVQGLARPVCLGRANGRYFTIMVGSGFDAHVVAGVNLKIKRLIGKGAYVLETLKQLLRGSLVRYQVTVDGIPYQAASVVVANAHYYGGRYVLAPDARIDEALFHVCLFVRSGRWSAARYVLAMLTGTITRLHDYRIVTGKQVEISGVEGDPVQGDGDVLTQLPVQVEMIPDVILLVGSSELDR